MRRLLRMITNQRNKSSILKDRQQLIPALKKVHCGKALIPPVTNEKWPIKSATVKNPTIGQVGTLFALRSLFDFTFRKTNLADVLITL